MLSFLLKLVLAHLMGDFLFQTANGVKNKQEKQHRSGFLYLHIGIHALVLLVLLQFNFEYWLGITTIVVSHFLIDLTKIKLHSRVNERWLFFMDQVAHFIILGGVVYWYYPFPVDFEMLVSPKVLILVNFLLLVTVVSSIMMKVLISRWDLSSFNDVSSLEKAGTYIGILERLFIFLFIAIDFWAGIGFLLTAKSVFRFGDLSKANDRKLTEYILIGTFLSFGMAILCGMGYRYMMEIVNTSL